MAGFYISVKNKLANTIVNTLGARLDNKVVIFDSDDWGTIRTPNKKVKDSLAREKLISNYNHYDENDCLESEEDLSALFDVLYRFNDSKGNHPILTFNTVMSNPDFDKIRENYFLKYSAESFQDTYLRYWNKNLIGLWNQGINNKLIFPQFHAAEHLNVSLWMEALQQGYSDVHKSFNHEYFGLSGVKTPSKYQNRYLAAYHNTSNEDLKEKLDILKNGLKQFESVFGHKSNSFIACNYVWNNDIEKVAYEMSVEIIKSQRAQLKPDINQGILKPVYHFNGQLSNYNQTYLVRNVVFEPAMNSNIDWVSKCMKEIANAFFWKQPAVICTHRVNYIGTLNEKNRKQSLQLLDTLIRSILKKWSNVSFVHSGVNNF